MSGSGSRDAGDDAEESDDHRHEPDREGRERSPRAERADADDDVTLEDDGLLRWFLRTDDGRVVAVRDVVSGVAIVALVGLILFAASGVWPPLVAVESGSMEPNMERGDLIFVVDDDRYAGDGAVDGVVTREVGAENGHATFGQPGDVIIFRPDGSDFRTPVIHRAHFRVDAGDDWVARADPAAVGGASCAAVTTCPAAHDGFVTKGDANQAYDQATETGVETDVVRSEWVVGKAMFRIPYLGYIRLAFESVLAVTGPIGVPVGLVAGGTAVGIGRRYAVW